MSRLKFWNDDSQSWEYADLSNNNISGIGAGLTQAQIDALDGLFKVCAYTTNPSIEYQAFKDAFAGGGILPPPMPPAPEGSFSIANRLANVKNSNSVTSVVKNASYTAKLTADSGYRLDNVTVEMGGINVTESVYSNGSINIPNVTGNIVITARSVKVSTLDIPEDGLFLYYDMREPLGKGDYIKDKSKNKRDVLFYKNNGTYENGYITRKDYVSYKPIVDYKKINSPRNGTVLVTSSNAPTTTACPLCHVFGRDLLYFQNKVIIYGGGFTVGDESVKLEIANTNTIAWSFNAQNQTKLYINGVLKRTYNETANASDFYTAPLTGYSNRAVDIPTEVHNMAVYDKVLTDEEILQISNTLFENAGGVK